MKSTITTHLFPTSSPEMAATSLKLLLKGSKNPEIYDNTAQIIKIITHTSYLLFFSSGRSSLFYALKSLNLRPGDEVILQSFTCSVVPDAIITNGLTPVYIDIDPTTLTLSPTDLEQKISSRTRVVIFQHTFGCPKHLKGVSDVCRKAGITLIEDKAHIIDDFPLYGRIGILSFGRTKWLSSVFGGALLTNDLKTLRSLQRLTSHLPPPPPVWVVQQLLQSPLLEYCVRPWLGVFKLGHIFHGVLNASNLMSKEVTQQEKQGKLGRIIDQSYSPLLCHLLFTQLQHYSDLLKTRLRAIETYQHLLPSQIKFPGFNAARPYLYYPIQVSSPQTLYRCAKRSNVYLGNWYYPPVSPPGTNYQALMYDPTSCPNAERVSRHIVNLPTLISADQVQRVIQVVNSCI